jgi:hypothetical protein
MYYVPPPPLVHVIPQKAQKFQCSCAPKLFSDKRVNESTETRVKTVSK